MSRGVCLAIGTGVDVKRMVCYHWYWSRRQEEGGLSLVLEWMYR